MRCYELKESLLRQVRNMHSQVLEAVLEQNKTHLQSLQAEYQMISTTLMTEATDCKELKDLQDFTNKASAALGDLYDQYITGCFERVKFLNNNKHRLGREDVDLLKNVYLSPSNMKQFMSKSIESQMQKKRALEEQLGLLTECVTGCRVTFDFALQRKISVAWRMRSTRS